MPWAPAGHEATRSRVASCVPPWLPADTERCGGPFVGVGIRGVRRRRTPMQGEDMGFLDRLLGREPLQQQRPQQPQPPTGQPYAVPAPRGGASSEDERAIARYKYLLRTAPPEDIERVHTEAFAKLSPEQRQMVLQRLNEDLPEGERPRSDEPADLARSATRAEMSRPGYLQGAFGGGRGGMGMGGMGMGGMGMGGMIAG